MTDLDLCYTPATELARLIARKKLSPVELVRNTLARIEAVNPVINCFCFVYPEEAPEKAKAAEAAVMRGDALGPLHGVPYALKDLTPTRGKRTTLGSKAYENWVPDYDAPIAEALDKAGGILVGKTTTPEFAYSGFTDSPLWGYTRNPWNRAKTSGGSSGGSGAAVAAGCVPGAEGSDMGGSVRIPASFCGIAGLKPSFGRIPFTILPSQFDQLSHFGPLARTVSDVALFLSITQGPDERDIQSLKPALDIPIPVPASAKGLRLALSIDLGFAWVDPEVEAAVRRSAAALADAGAVVEEVELGWDWQLNDLWVAHWCVYLATFFGHTLKTHRDQLDPNVVRLMEAGLAMNAVEFKRIEIARTEQWKKLSPILERYDALICPTMSMTARDVEARNAEYGKLDANGKYRGLDMTSVFNFVSQCPAFSVPCGFASDGLPIGLQIVGRRFDDLTALRVGAALEAVQPWADKRPPV
jgi:Asp-tRNA(Asn)/Glu-tRNA(Gln) amidotransferase A subunit family amidase